MLIGGVVSVMKGCSVDRWCCGCVMKGCSVDRWCCECDEGL